MTMSRASVETISTAMATGEGDGVVVVAAVAMEMEAGLGAAVMARIGQVFRCSRTV